MCGCPSICGGAPYHFLDHLWVRYDDLTLVIHELLKDSKFEEEVKQLAINVGTHVSNYWQHPALRAVESLDDVDAFVEAFLTAFKEAERDFVNTYSDVSNAVHECTLFYTKWPREMGPFKSAFCLIAYGIQTGDTDKIEMGIKRIRAKIDFSQVQTEKDLMLAVAARAEEVLKSIKK